MATFVCGRCSHVIISFDCPQSCPSCGFTFDNAADSTNSQLPELQVPETVTAFVAQPPKRIGRYEIRSMLGQGGFGSVYLAWDPQLERLVALKLPNERVRSRPDSLKRFVREGRAVAQFRHYGIVGVYDVENADGLIVLVSEYVAGETLSRCLARGRYSPRNAASIVAAVASAVQYAHSKGILHRDIKPANIMMDDAGNPRLMDFGLAKRIDIEETLTADNQILGTLPYMSPEQSHGSANTIDHRTDVYSLGVTLYQLLTGKLPYSGDLSTIRSRLRNDEPPRPRSLDKQIPVDLETICLKAIEKRPEDRYQTAGELADDLERWLRGEPIWVRHVGRIERTWRWSKRNPVMASLLASVAVLLVTISSVSMAAAAIETGRRKAEQLRANQEAEARAAAELAKRQIAEALKKNKALLSDYYLRESERRIMAPESSDEFNPSQAIVYDLEAAKVDQDNPDRLQADKIRLSTALALTPRIEQMWFFKTPLAASGISRGHDLFFVAEPDGTVSLHRIAGDPPRAAVLPHPGPVTAGAFSPNGRLLATGSNDGVRIWEVATQKLQGQPLTVPNATRAKRGDGNNDPIHSIRFSPSGEHLAVAFHSHVQLWNTKARALEREIKVRSSFAPEFGDSEQLLMVRTQNGPVAVYDRMSGKAKSTLGSPGQRWLNAAFAFDGVTVAVWGLSGDVEIWNASKAERIGLLPAADPNVPCSAVAFSPDSQLVATAMVNGAVKMWDIASSRTLWRSQVESRTIRQLHFSSNGMHLMVLGEQNRLSMLSAHSGMRAAPSITQPLLVECVDWANSVGHCLTRARDGVIRLWNFATAPQVLTIPHSYPLTHFSASANGSVIAITDAGNYCHVLRANATGMFDLNDIHSHSRGEDGGDAVCLSGDGSRLAFFGGRSASVWDTHTWRQVGNSMQHIASIVSARFSPGGEMLVTVTGDGKATVWSVATGEKRYTPVDVGRFPTGVDIDREGRRCAVASQRGVTAWELDSGRLVGPGLIARGASAHVRLLPGAREMAIGWIQKPPSLVEIASGQMHPSLGKQHHPSCLTLSNDGGKVFIGYADGEGRMWSTRTAEAASFSLRHSARITSATMDLSARWIAVVTAERHQPVKGSGSALSIWDVNNSALVSHIEPRLLSLPAVEQMQITESDHEIQLTLFAPNGRALYWVTKQGMIGWIPLEVARFEIDAMKGEVAIRSGTKFDGRGGLGVLEPSDLAESWKLHASQPSSTDMAFGFRSVLPYQSTAMQ